MKLFSGSIFVEYEMSWQPAA